GERLVGLVGLPGSGKSFTCARLIQSWTEKDVVAVTAPGDEYQKARRNFPFQHAVSQSSMSKQLLLKSASGAVAKGAAAIPFAGPLAGFVIEKLFAHAVDSAKERYQFLSTEEQNILYHLQRIAGKKSLLIICDDLQFWDEAAVSLLRLMLSGTINDAYPFLQAARYVVVQTIHTAGDPPLVDFASLVIERVSVDYLDYAGQGDLPQVLGMLGLEQQFPAEVIQAIHGICGGHLHVLQQLVSYLKTNSFSMADDWSRTAGADFVSNLVVSRLKAMGPVGKDLLEMLKTASVIGTIFSDQELACLCEREPPQVRKLLSAGEGMHLVHRGQQSTQFAHAIVHQSLCPGGTFETEDLHRQFSLCLKKLRPGDYRSRMRHLTAAGDKEAAAVLAVCGLLQDRRNGSASLDAGTLCELAAEVGLTGVLNLLCEAQDRVMTYDFKGALGLLNRMDPRTPLHLQAEGGYIKAMCLIKAYQYDTREEASNILQKWLGKLPDEGDLVVRMQSTQLVALTHQRREEEALAVESDIVQMLSRRVSFDADAADALMVLDRKADLLYPADQSHARLLRARNHFMPPQGGQPRNFYQYCASTLNLAANRIVCGEYSDALSYLRELASYLELNPDHRFTRFEVLTNNLIVSEFLGGVSDAATAARHFEQLTAKKIDTMDFALVLSNYGACAAMAEDFPLATKVLGPLVKKLRSEPEVDDLHMYLAGTNLASVMYLQGNHAEATALSHDLSCILDTAMPPHRAYFRDRHRILHEAMESGRTFTMTEWCELPKQAAHSGAGPCWRHYGRGFLFTDLQIFTES
ncbi:MAG: ATP-binding protein, partial [Gallionella sp.]|nr:ATP-binding protein [Gallionella sp.]